MKAVITAAGQPHRHLLLQTMADGKGLPMSILRMQLRDLQNAGIRRVGIVIQPGDEALLRDAAAEFGSLVQFIHQERPRGYGHAILCAEEFVNGEDFLLSIGDHLFVSNHSEKNCYQQVMEASQRMEAAMSAVQGTHESSIRHFGTIGGEWIDDDRRLLRINEVIEKPTPTLAEQRLMVSGLRAGFYLSYFGIHVLHSTIFQHLRTLLESSTATEAISLTDAVQRMMAEEDYYAIEVEGRRFDLEAPFGLLHGQLALALRSPARDQILTDLLNLVADR